MAASMKKYLLACRTAPVFRRSTSRDFTNAECRYRLCGMITAPMTPTAWSNSLLPQFEHQGTKRPSNTLPYRWKKKKFKKKLLLWAKIKWTSKKHEKYCHTFKVGTLGGHIPLCLKFYKIRTTMKNFKNPNFKMKW